MGSITCFKLCYALGVSEPELEASYPLEYKVGMEHGAFVQTERVKRFRQLSHLYFSNIKNLQGGMLPVLQAAINEHNNMIVTVYNDLRIGLPEDLFVQLTELPQLTPRVIAQLSFIASKVNHIHGLYFFGQELLNVALGTMLQDDTSLRDRLCLVSGRRLESVVDTSSFHSAIQEYIAQAFITGKDLSKFSKLYIFPGTCESKLNYRLASKLPELLGLPELSEGQPLLPGEACVTADAKWIAATAPKYPESTFIAVMPVEFRFYKAWKRRTLENIYFLDLK